MWASRAAIAVALIWPRLGSKTSQWMTARLIFAPTSRIALK
jgi:hypothetical protein